MIATLMGVHSFTLSYTPGSMKCDSQASHLAHTFASPCFGREPKAKVATHSLSYSQHFKKKFNSCVKLLSTPKVVSWGGYESIAKGCIHNAPNK
jgi:hypothetical protein